MKPIQIISKDVFDKIRSRFSNLQMGDETGAVTIDPTEARFFDFDFVIEGENLGRVSLSLNDLGSLKVYYSQGITENLDAEIKKKWYSFLREMRYFAMRRLLRFDTRDIAKTNLDKNDFQHLAATQGPKEEEPMKNEASKKINENRIPVDHATKAVEKLLGRNGAVKFLTHLRPGSNKQTTWNDINSALMSQGVKPTHITKIATYLSPSQYNVNESKWNTKSTAKTSRAVTGRTEVIVRHGQPVGEYAGARSQKKNIKGIFIQNSAGERYKYPFIHPAGAFAMAQHVDHGGVPHDPAGKAIIAMSEEIAQLQEFQRKIQRASLHDDAMGITEKAVGRLNQLKEKVALLGKKHHYECWMKEFNEVEHNEQLVSELDAITLEDYKSKFTQKTFEEELTKYFPLLHRIMKETNKVELEDYVSEGHSSELESGLHNLLQNNDPENEEILDAIVVSSKYGTEVQDYLRNLYDEVAYEYKLDPDKGVDKILDIMHDKLANEYGDADVSDTDGDVGDEPADKFEAWAEAVEQGKLTDDQIEELKQELGKLPMTDQGPQLELGPEGQTAWQFFSGLGLDDTDLKDKLQKATDVDDSMNAIEVFDKWARENYPEILVALGVSDDQETKETTLPPTGAPGLSTVHGTMENDDGQGLGNVMSKENKHDPKDVIKEVAKIVKSFYNRDNPEVGPFRGNEGIVLDVKKTIAEKFGEDMGEQAGQLAEKFISKLTQEWQERHGVNAPVDQDDGLARLKELVQKVKGKMENIR